MQHFLFTATHVQLTAECRARIIEDCIAPNHFEAEDAWELGAQSKKRGFSSSLYLVVRDLILFEIEIHSRHKQQMKSASSLVEQSHLNLLFWVSINAHQHCTL